MQSPPKPIQMVDLKSQHQHIRPDLDEAMDRVIQMGAFINGPEVDMFADDLADYLQTGYVVPCGNGTDALQLALMALDLPAGGEILVPSFNYVAAAEAIVLLGYTPVFVDADPATFNMDAADAARKLSPNTVAIIAVHLFGQCCPMQELLDLAQENNLPLIEDTAQAIGAEYDLPGAGEVFAGTMGTIGTTSFFPSKNLGCMGDGGALFTESQELASRVKALANHGQKKKYYYSEIGINSRLDSLQAAILRVKLKHLPAYTEARQQAADWYDEYLGQSEHWELPYRAPYSSHVFHQYTLKVPARRDELKAWLQKKGIPSMVYYPLPLHAQAAYSQFVKQGDSLPVADKLSREVLSLPMHTELDEAQIEYIAASIKEFFR
jgi:UDP-2-acetamido-2-deoxy-ribo-hexuluronate aminotransferase